MNDGTQYLFAAHQNLLRERLQYILNQLHPRLCSDIMRVLEDPGKLYSPQNFAAMSLEKEPPAGLWSLLTLLVAQYISPDIDPLIACAVAVGVECFICAADLLDDIEDGDHTSVLSELGLARTLNVSSALLMLAQQSFVSLYLHGDTSKLIILLLNAFEDIAIKSVTGQHLDLLAEKDAIEDLDQEKCIEIVARKSGTLMSLPFVLGSLCAGADPEVSDTLAELGRLLGIASQLDNDCHDLHSILQDTYSSADACVIETIKKSIKTDLIRNKKTLPIVLAGLPENILRQIMQPDGVSIADASLHALREGILATWGISLLYREQANDCLLKIEAWRPIPLALRFLLTL